MNTLKKYLVIATMVFVILTDNFCLAGDQEQQEEEEQEAGEEQVDEETAKLMKELKEVCEKDILATIFTRPECKDNDLYRQTRDMRPYVEYISKYIDSNLFHAQLEDKNQPDDEKKKRRNRFDFIHFLVTGITVKGTCDLNSVCKELHKDGDPEEYAENFKRVLEILHFTKQSEIDEETEAYRTKIKNDLAKTTELIKNAGTAEEKAKATEDHDLFERLLENSKNTPTEQAYFFRKVYLEYVPDYLQHNKQLFKGEDLKFFESLDDNFKTQFNERLIAIALQCYIPETANLEYGKCPSTFCERVVEYDIQKAAEHKKLLEKYKNNEEAKSEM